MRMPLFAVLSALLCLSAAPGLVQAADVPAPDPAPSAATPVAKDPVFSQEQLDQMLARMDIISVNCPHTPATYHLLSARRLKLMRPDAIRPSPRS